MCLFLILKDINDTVKVSNDNHDNSKTVWKVKTVYFNKRFNMRL